MLFLLTAKFINGCYDEANISKKLETWNYWKLLLACTLHENQFRISENFYHVACKKVLTKLREIKFNVTTWWLQLVLFVNMKMQSNWYNQSMIPLV